VTRLRASRLLLLALAAGAVAVLAAPASAGSSALAPTTLTHARLIAGQVGARYRLLPGRKLAVTETTPLGVVDSLTLVTGSELRVVPAADGIYFAICSLGVRCPYPLRSAWPAAAPLPRRLALELALRTFVETRVSVVVVALPTAEPVWAVFEREQFLSDVDAPAALDELAAAPSLSSGLPLRALVDRLTLARLFRPLPLLPPPKDTLYAVRL
jgi:hypothetical protein